MERRLSTQIYNAIRERIDQGVYGPRSFLNEGQLASDFGVSRAPVRDALHLLCGQGYLISYPRKGYMVNVFSTKEVNYMQQIRRHLERLSLQLVIQNATDGEICSLRQFTQTSGADLAETNHNLFHMRLAELSGNPYLPAVLKGKVCFAAIRRESDLGRHEAIIEALLARDLPAAEAALDQDVYLTGTNCPSGGHPLGTAAFFRALLNISLEYDCVLQDTKRATRAWKPRRPVAF